MLFRSVVMLFVIGIDIANAETTLPAGDTQVHCFTTEEKEYREKYNFMLGRQTGYYEYNKDLATKFDKVCTLQGTPTITLYFANKYKVEITCPQGEK